MGEISAIRFLYNFRIFILAFEKVSNDLVPTWFVIASDSSKETSEVYCIRVRGGRVPNFIRIKNYSLPYFLTFYLCFGEVDRNQVDELFEVELDIYFLNELNGNVSKLFIFVLCLLRSKWLKAFYKKKSYIDVVVQGDEW